MSMPHFCFYRMSIGLLFIMATSTPPAHANEPSAAEALEFFERDIRPLLVEHCYSCHSAIAEKLQAGLLVDSREALLQGGDSGEAIVPGNTDDSLFIQAVRYESYEMPPKGKLPDDVIKKFERWVEMGAPWPAEDSPTKQAAEPKFDLEARKAQHWVWQPIQTPTLPTVKDQTWPRSELDRFILARLEEAQLHPSADTDRTALLRRLYLDLIGLPPSPDQIKAFLADQSPQAVERVVDELLQSAHFGERWGRHWLDLVRYAESRGHEFDNDARNAYQYRDYVIRAFNADVPYDQLVREHIAGDLLETPRLNPDQGFNESILGTGFWFLGEWVHSPVDIRKDESDRFDNMVDVMSKTFLGVTVSCARCHDHKFDAISTADYYSLCGFLQSSDFRQVPFESLEHNRRIASKLADLDARYRKTLEDALSLTPTNQISAPELSPAAAATVVVDYSQIAPDQFLQDGFLFGNQPRLAGTPYLESNNGEPVLQFASRSAAVSDPFWHGLEGVSEAGVRDQSRLASLPLGGRTLRTPTFELTSGIISCRVRGSGHIVACVDSHRLIAGPLHGETVRGFGTNEEWVEMNLTRYIGHRLHLEFVPNADATLDVAVVLQGASPEIRGEIQKREETIAGNVKAIQDATTAKMNDPSKATLRAWLDERTQLQTQVMRRSRLAMAMMDGTGEDEHILIRGNSSKPGKVEPRHFLTAVTGNQPMAIKSGSGRLELANQINDPSNPLTSRVVANRIWHYLMGRGVVPTTDDFGVLGQAPSDPALLDHLATQFRARGQSIKQMIRYIVLSRTYQMSSLADSAAVAADPNNLRWHHRPPKRLEGEAIRDSLLKMSGRLDPTLFGEPIPIHLTAFMDGRGRPGHSGPLDGAGRRSIYISVRRNFISPFMLAFDTPVPFSTMGRRNVSNVPAQALILMNDPFVVEQAKRWAELAIKQSTSPESRVEWMYLSAFSRLPRSDENAIALAYISAQSALPQPPNEVELWTDVAHALINTKEFIFLR
jgi:hypothetical protein